MARSSSRRTSGGTKVTTSPGSVRNETEEPMAGINLPNLEEQDQQTSNPNADRLSQARALLAANADEQERAILGAPPMDPPHNLDTGADTAGLPTALRAQIVQENAGRTQRTTLARVAANRLPGSTDLRTSGKSEDVSGVVEIERGQIVCPNCGRSRQYQYNLAGSVIPCLCGFEIEVPYPDQFRAMMADAPPAAEEGDTAPVQLPEDDQNPNGGGEQE